MRLAVFALLTASLLAEPLRIPFFRQEKNGCGAASVAMVAHYWNPGAPDPASIYDRLIDADRKGIELAEMKRFLSDLGFRAFTIRGQWSDLEEHLGKGRPLIVALRSSIRQQLHFAVLAGVEDGRVWLNDPTKKRVQRVGRERFEKQWNAGDNWMLLATPRASAKPEQ